MMIKIFITNKSLEDKNSKEDILRDNIDDIGQIDLDEDDKKI